MHFQDARRDLHLWYSIGGRISFPSENKGPNVCPLTDLDGWNEQLDLLLGQEHR